MSTDGVRKIIEEIEKSTEQKCSEILSEAKEKVEAVLNEARKKASDEEGTILARGEQEARRESQRILAEARIKARREKVKAQEGVVQKSFDTARKTLLKMAEEKKAAGIEYRDVLERLIRESAVSSGIQSLEVLVNPRDRSLASQDVLSRIASQAGKELGIPMSLDISDEPLACMGGVVVRSNDGKVRVENTFESRIERFREAIRTQVAKELFSGE
jgi:V/A-type H+-transporting ATPase subunit E